LKDWLTQPNAEFVTGPTVFRQGDRELVAAATRDGRLLLLDAAALGGPDHASAQASAPIVLAGGSIAADALATWQEMTIEPPAPAPAPAPGAPPAGFGGGAGAAPLNVTYGARWIVAATTSGLVSLKMTDSSPAPTLARGWTADGTVATTTPIVVNGVVFALSSGSASATAVLKAFEGTTGKLLWDSRETMKSPASAGSFWSALSQVYVGTNDGTLYAFGFADERR
jgi:hypothetical protein